MGSSLWEAKLHRLENRFPDLLYTLSRWLPHRQLSSLPGAVQGAVWTAPM